MVHGDIRAGGGRRPGRRGQLLRRFVGASVLLLLGAGILWGRCALGEADEEAHLKRGSAALLRALEGDGSAWDEAEEAYGRAARTTLLDGYPLFALELTRQLRSGRLDVPDPAARSVLEAVGRVELAEARRRLEEVPEGRSRAWLERLVASLERAESRSAEESSQRSRPGASPGS